MKKTLLAFAVGLVSSACTAALPQAQDSQTTEPLALSSAFCAGEHDTFDNDATDAPCVSRRYSQKAFYVSFREDRTDYPWGITLEGTHDANGRLGATDLGMMESANFDLLEQFGVVPAEADVVTRHVMSRDNQSGDIQAKSVSSFYRHILPDGREVLRDRIVVSRRLDTGAVRKVFFNWHPGVSVPQGASFEASHLAAQQGTSGRNLDTPRYSEAWMPDDNDVVRATVIASWTSRLGPDDPGSGVNEYYVDGVKLTPPPVVPR
jgi:hypothetical protein